MKLIKTNIIYIVAMIFIDRVCQKKKKKNRRKAGI